MTNCSVQRAGQQHLDELADLFDQYRRFYRQRSDRAAARAFLHQRMVAEESVIFLAQQRADNRPIGFTQLYPTFSSIRIGRVWTLNDLFVVEDGRGCGVGRDLMRAAHEFAISTGAVGIELATEKTNLSAQKLYQSLGYELEEDYRHYSLTLQR